MNMIQYRYSQRRFTSIALAFVTVALISSCAKENPSDPSSPPTAVFDWPAVCTNVSVPNCTAPAYLRLSPDWNNCSLYKFTMTVRNASNQTLANVPVRIEWLNYDYGSYVIQTDQTGNNITHTYASGKHTFSATTDANGVAAFWITGSLTEGTILYNVCVENDFDDFAKAKLYACDKFIRNVTVSSPDLNNTQAVDDGDGGDDDYQLFLEDEFCEAGPSLYYSRTDFDGNHVRNGADLSLMLQFLSDGGQGCP